MRKKKAAFSVDNSPITAKVLQLSAFVVIGLMHPNSDQLVAEFAVHLIMIDSNESTRKLHWPGSKWQFASSAIH